MLVDKHTSCVQRLYVPSSDDTTSGTKSDDVCSRNRAHRRSSCVIRSPCKEARPTRESANGKQEYASVLDVRVRCPSHNRKASDCGDREDGDVYATTVGFVRDKGNRNGNNGRANVGGHRVELRFGGCPTEISENSGLITLVGRLP